MLYANIRYSVACYALYIERNKADGVREQGKADGVDGEAMSTGGGSG